MNDMRFDLVLSGKSRESERPSPCRGGGAREKKRDADRRRQPKLLKAFLAVLVVAAIVCGASGCSNPIVRGISAIIEGNSISESVSDEGKRIRLYRSDAKHVAVDEESGVCFIDNELVLSLDPDADVESVEAVVRPYGGTVAGFNDYFHTFQIVFNRDHSYPEMKRVSEEIQKQLPSAAAMPNYVLRVGVDGYYPNDTELAGERGKKGDGKTWNLEAIRVPEMWETYLRMDKYPVNVGVLDNQFYTDHEDLNFVDVFLNEFKAERDGPKHGTNVAGVIAAGFDNGKGVAGIAPDVNLFGASFSGLSDRPVQTDIYGNTVVEYEAGFAYLIGNKHCKVINLSYGGAIGDDLDAEDDLIARHIESSLLSLIDEGYDFLISKSAGNNGMDYDDYDLLSRMKDPRVLDRIIVVGAAMIYDDGSIYLARLDDWATNYGDAVDLIAPGYKICTTSVVRPIWWLEGGYTEKFGGTSAAAPHVSGVAAAIWTVFPALSGPEMKRIICSTASGSYGFRSAGDNQAGASFRYPLLDACAAMQEAIRYTQEKQQAGGEQDDPDASRGDGVFEETGTQAAPVTWQEAYGRFVMGREYLSKHPMVIQVSDMNGKHELTPEAAARLFLHDFDSDGTPELLVSIQYDFSAFPQEYTYGLYSGPYTYCYVFDGSEIREPSTGFGPPYYYLQGIDPVENGIFHMGSSGAEDCIYYLYKDGEKLKSEWVADIWYNYEDNGESPSTTTIYNEARYAAFESQDLKKIVSYSREEIDAMGWNAFLEQYGYDPLPMLILSYNSDSLISFHWEWPLFSGRSDQGSGGSSYNRDLAKAAVYLCEGTYLGQEEAETRMRDLGFTDPSSEYYPEDNQTNTSPITLASVVTELKGERFLIVAVAVRGTNDPWDIITDVRSGFLNIDGFAEAGEAGEKVVQKYCKSLQEQNMIDIDHTVLFATGHSLGAAIAGQIAGNLENAVARREHIFAYTFASPYYETHGKTTGAFTNIHNIVNSEDAVPKFPLGGQRYGVDVTFKGTGSDLVDQHMLDTYYLWLVKEVDAGSR